MVGDNQTNIRQRASENQRPLCFKASTDGQAALRRPATMAGSTDGWKFQINPALRIRCSKNCASFALACLAMFVSRSYGSRPKNKTHGMPPQWRSGAFVFRLNCGRVLLSATLIADLNPHPTICRL